MPLIKHRLRDRGEDLYETPPEATKALLSVERLNGRIWEPACGRGAISEVLRAAGHEVYSSDLVSYGYGDSGIDFLLEFKAPPGVTTILSNPPYKTAGEFVRKGLALAPTVIMLLRLTFLEGVGRSDILDGGSLARVHVFAYRLPLMHRDGWTGPKATNTVAFAWFCWDRNHTGPATINRLHRANGESPQIVSSKDHRGNNTLPLDY